MLNILNNPYKRKMSKLQCEKNQVVLSYFDSILRQADVDLLNGPFWLNDAIISFYFEYLGQKYESASCKFLFISPELTQLLKLTNSQEYSIFLDPIEAKEKDFIFFPLNDCNSRSSAGGSHWSLIVFSKSEKACFYFDSSCGMNTSIARGFSKNLMNYLLEETNGQFIEVDCPQQKNGYDCGLFVLCFADIICQQIIVSSKIEKCNCDSVVNLVSKKRETLLALIDKLKETTH